MAKKVKKKSMHASRKTSVENAPQVEPSSHSDAPEASTSSTKVDSCRPSVINKRKNSKHSSPPVVPTSSSSSSNTVPDSPPESPRFGPMGARFGEGNEFTPGAAAGLVRNLSSRRSASTALVKLPGSLSSNNSFNGPVRRRRVAASSAQRGGPSDKAHARRTISISGPLDASSSSASERRVTRQATSRHPSLDELKAGKKRDVGGISALCFFLTIVAIAVVLSNVVTFVIMYTSSRVTVDNIRGNSLRSLKTLAGYTRQSIGAISRQLHSEVISKLDLQVRSHMGVPPPVNLQLSRLIHLAQLDVVNDEQDFIVLHNALRMATQDNTELSYVGAGLKNGQYSAFYRSSADTSTAVFQEWLTNGTKSDSQELIVDVYDVNIASGTRMGPIAGEWTFDPRTRPWYQAAVESGVAGWSGVYFWAGYPAELGIAATLPFFNPPAGVDDDGQVDRTLNGVLSIDYSLSSLSQFLSAQNFSRSGVSYIIERSGPNSGSLIAASSGEFSSLSCPDSSEEPQLQRAPDGSERPVCQSTGETATPGRISPSESSSAIVRVSFTELAMRFGDDVTQLPTESTTEVQLVDLSLGNEDHVAECAEKVSAGDYDHLSVYVDVKDPGSRKRRGAAHATMPRFELKRQEGLSDDSAVSAEDHLFESEDHCISRLIVHTALIKDNSGLDWLLIVAVPEDDFLFAVNEHSRDAVDELERIDDASIFSLNISTAFTFGAIAISLIISVLATSYATRAFIRPIKVLGSNMRRLEKLDFGESDETPKGSCSSRVTLDGNYVGAISEIRQCMVSYRYMRAGLSAFSRFVPNGVVRRIVSGEERADQLYVELRRTTILFTDIEGFTSISERLEPRELVRMLDIYMTCMCDVVEEHEGEVGDLMGDGLHAFWNASERVLRHERKACVAALRQQELLVVLNRQFEQHGWPALRMRIGLHTGEVHAGNIGSPKRMKFGVLGDVVNLSSRLEGLCKQYDVSILITRETLEPVCDEFVTRCMDYAAVKGKALGVWIYELIGKVDVVSEEKKREAAVYSRAVLAYYERDLSATQEALQEYLSIHKPTKQRDRALATLKKRVEDAATNGNWIKMTSWEIK